MNACGSSPDSWRAKRWPSCVGNSISHARPAYKIFERYKDYGAHGLSDRSKRPYRQANKLPAQLERLILRIKREHPTWGAPKVREKLRRSQSDIQLPAISTVHAVLDRHGLVSRGRQRRHRAEGTALSKPLAPNELWCADYKGEFMLADRRYCYPLTISDFATRYLLTCEALATTKGRPCLRRLRTRLQRIWLA
jgi:putative transposase